MKRWISILLCLALFVSLLTGIAAALSEDDVAGTPASVDVQEPAADEPADVPADEPADVPADDPADVPADDPADVPADEPADVPADEPADVPADEPADVPADDPADVPADDPADVPADEPADVPADEPTSAFDVDAAYAKLMALETAEEITAYLETLTEEEGSALSARLSDADAVLLAGRLGYSFEDEVITPAKNYTAVGPLMPPVTVRSLWRMMRAPASGEQENGLILDKTTDAVDGGYKITLEAYTTGTVKSNTKSIPTDIVLVLDESGSMADPMNSYSEVYTLDKSQTYYVKRGDSYVAVKWCSSSPHTAGWYTGFHLSFFLLNFHIGTEYVPMESAQDTTSGRVQFYTRSATSTSKNAALKAAAGQFVSSVYEDAVANDVDHRVAVIGFSGNNSATTKTGLTSDIRNNLSTVQSAINGLGANGGTYIEDGMELAKQAFDNAAPTTATTRNRVVVIFTDGIPGSGTWNDTTIKDSANPAISDAHDLKTTYGATVYSIGMLDDANPELEISDQSTTDIARTNKFLHYLSSNYPNATSMTNGGTGGNQGYYLAASDAASLNAIFEKIKEEIATPSINLDSETLVKDTVSQYFDLPENAGDISVKTYACTSYNDATGEATWSSTGTTLSDAVTLDAENNAVQVTGFDFNANFVSETAKSDGSHGAKIVIEFIVTAKDGFLGGNDVPTNDYQNSGVYDKTGALVEQFADANTTPTVNVPISEPTFTANDKTIYEGDRVSVTDLYTLPTFTGDDAWKAAFVNISGTTGSAVTPDDCKDYTITVTYAPKTDGANSAGTANAMSGVPKEQTAVVHVLKPTVTATVNDVQAYYGESYTLGDGVTGSITVTWTDLHGHTGIPAASGSAPYTQNDLQLAYSLADSTNRTITVPKTDVDVTVKVMKGTDEIPATITTTCGYGCADATDGKYTVHVQTCQLTVTKAGGVTGETYVFNIYKDNELYTQAAIAGNGSVTIYELPVGTYTIEEDTGWSWRSNAAYSGSAALSSTSSSGTITCTNSSNGLTKWLNGFSSIVSNVFGVSKGGN